ncbi:RNA polymerase sigma factor [Frankia sp. AgKG'84/4]|uniref:RNA polymerase subunit sigma-24 n=1 Tax=Frankia sp. AgKG'84/4 TaxID=573490 RepID=UPI00200F3CCF|nr:RNA polymerase subunit sigma-24 [Frankia sp. AgKG'84/4]MCL9794336.1 RNA polymerase subunit sigma-24 [Frankia sp. AgKG'84/4]
MDDDADLVARVRRGDRQAFDDLYDLYADDVFSMCLLILGDPTVARAAAGTAFALVARTRLNPLSNPAGLRSWLLELARGSALAWSGSPQARSIPVPHGVRPEELLVGAVVPAPASLRVGLSRTFDRAAAVAEAAANRRAAMSAASTTRAAAVPTSPPEPAPAPKISLVKGMAAQPAVAGAAADGDVPRAGSAGDDLDVELDVELADSKAATRVPAAAVRALPLMRMDADAGDGAVGVEEGRLALVWRGRPALAAAAAMIVAAAGLTAAMNWPSADPQLMSESGVAIVHSAPSEAVVRPSTAPAAPTGRDLATRPITPTVAGAFTSRAATPDGRAPRQPRLVEPIARDVHRTQPAVAKPASAPRVTLSESPTSPAEHVVVPSTPATTAPTTVTPTVPATPISPTSSAPATRTPGPTVPAPPTVTAPVTTAPAPTSAAPLPTTPTVPTTPPAPVTRSATSAQTTAPPATGGTAPTPTQSGKSTAPATPAPQLV